VGFYNVIFGEAQESTLLLQALGLSRADFYRYRDCYRAADDMVAVYTRGGGNNRWVYDEDGDQTDQENPQHLALRQHPLYEADEDDDYDSTYRTFYFRAPDELRANLANIPVGKKRDQAWAEFLASLREGA
jgi:hypothetical protein